MMATRHLGTAPRLERARVRLWRTARIALAGTFIVGCARPPERFEPELDIEPAPTWTAPGVDGAVRDAPRDSAAVWWSEFGDVALDSLVARTLTHNYDLRAAVVRVDAALAQARLAGAEGLPQVSARFSRSRDRRNFLGTPIPSSTTTSYGVSLDASWEIDLWGRIRSAQSGALADAQAAWADAHAARLSLAAQTAKAYFAVTEARLQVDLARETVETRRTGLRSVRERFERGTRSPLDVRLAHSSLAGAEALLERQQSIYDRSRRQLEILLGRYPAARVEGADSLQATPPAIPVGLPSDLVLRRPDLVAAERRMAAAGARVSAARRAFLPRISLTGSAGSTSTALENLAEGDFFVWSLIGGLVQPIFQGGRLRAQHQLAQADAERLLAHYAQTLLHAFAEVENALASEAFLAAEERALSTSASQATAAQRLAEERYRGGLEPYITVLEAQRRALLARGTLISVRRERLDARVNLHLALGGSFELPLRDDGKLDVDPGTIHETAGGDSP